jgi:hypothetical protein
MISSEERWEKVEQESYRFYLTHYTLPVYRRMADRGDKNELADPANEAEGEGSGGIGEKSINCWEKSGSATCIGVNRGCGCMWGKPWKSSFKCSWGMGYDTSWLCG